MLSARMDDTVEVESTPRRVPYSAYGCTAAVLSEELAGAPHQGEPTHPKTPGRL